MEVLLSRDNECWYYKVYHDCIKLYAVGLLNLLEVRRSPCG
jgi:hypothetical protein